MAKSKTKKSKPIKSSANQVPSKFAQLKSGEFYQALIAEPNALNRFYHVLASRLIDGKVFLVHFVLESSGQFQMYYNEWSDRLSFETIKSEYYLEGIHFKSTSPSVAKKLILSAIAQSEQNDYIVPSSLNILKNIFYDISTEDATDVEFIFK